MKLFYDDKSIELKECISFFDRLKGFMFKKEIDKALLFGKCNSIHTFFMIAEIDVIMCDEDNNILYYYPSLRKNRIIFPKRGVRKTIELPPKYFNIKCNTKIRME